MKKIFFVVVTAAMLAACGSSQQQQAQSNSGDANASSDGKAQLSSANANKADAPVMKFEEEAFDFGKIKKGEKVTHAFKFTNTGKTPLIVTNATATCGCTTPTWPKSPIKPGDSGVISVTFDSSSKQPGLQDKQITVEANTNPGANVVHLIGEVVAAK
ncbi:uncharacterized protein DUF1573 [Mucilaginibacter yixingensis]|uniref:Uncharacterized protein DUF1573 n=1 Tax=Mucilaginibacter yixingensis TaxID=1295612 RepID=A0A2T5JFW5_9SPHI|nr:DUF1573 domain-containing protein [Mucilaginibacter yixingensis]PTR01317.1 uncharacterized protein DUF1573 [Mucilaginibacter yixingensis]